MSETEDTPPPSLLGRLTGGTLPSGDAAGSGPGPFVLVAGAVAFGLVVLRAERLPVAYPNDSAVHSLTVAWATSQIAAGHFPLDGWFPFLSLGSPFFLHYQSFSAVVAGLFGQIFPPAQVFSWSLYLGLSLWPVAVYAGARLMRFDRWSAGCAAALAPLAANTVGYGFEHEAYMFYGSGLWSMLWGMLLLPIALGFAWRAVARHEHVPAAVLSLGGMIILHFLLAYLACLALVLFVLLRPSELVRRVRRAVIVGAGALLIVSWVLVPLIATANYAATNEFETGTYFDNSYGAHQVLTWLFHGQIFDAQLGASRLPVFSVLAAIGFVTCIVRWRKDERARLVVCFFVLSLLLYFGRPTLGPVINLLPDNSDLLLHRYVAGVQLGGMFLGGIGLVACAGVLRALYRKTAGRIAFGNRNATPRKLTRVLVSVIAVAAVVGVLEPAWHQIGTYDAFDAISIHDQRASDATAGAEMNVLLNRIRADGGGRVYAGMPSNWGYSFKVGQVQTYIYLADEEMDAVGFTLRTSSLMTDPEAYFDEAQPGDYELFGIHWLIFPNGSDGQTADTPEVPATLVETSGPFNLYAVANTGYIHVVDTTGSLVANATNLGATTRSYLAGNLSSIGDYESVAFNGQPAAPPTVSAANPAVGSPGAVADEVDNLTEGEASAVVTANRTAVVMLSASYDPGWTVTVDGRPAKTVIVAPALVGVMVSRGVHQIAFRYQAYSLYPELFAVSILTAIGFFVVCRRREKRAVPAEAAPTSASD